MPSSLLSHSKTAFSQRPDNCVLGKHMEEMALEFRSLLIHQEQDFDMFPSLLETATGVKQENLMDKI